MMVSITTKEELEKCSDAINDIALGLDSIEEYILENMDGLMPGLMPSSMIEMIKLISSIKAKLAKVNPDAYGLYLDRLLEDRWG